MNYIDLFAGCGGLSLGLMKAGWQGIFAVEKNPLAFETLQHNLINPSTNWCFSWPHWLPQAPLDIKALLEQHTLRLRELRGQVALVAGGPPCQGYSFAGRRNHNDERNHLVNKYLDVVELVQPDVVLLENVRGITVAFEDKVSKNIDGKIKASKSLLSGAEEIKKALHNQYYVFDRIIKSLSFGVPQYRPRYIMIAVKKSLFLDELSIVDPFTFIEAQRQAFLQSIDLPLRNITLGEAISDLKKSHGTILNEENPAFQHGLYGPIQGRYQRLLKVSRDGHRLGDTVIPDSHRFANHRDETIAKFRRIMRRQHGKQISDRDRETLGIGKHAVTPLSRTLPSHTLTTLPDDLIHYSEPRILTVRESARVQSFPDWFQFRGKYTTGAEVRKDEVPRYTQVGNAVPPLMGEGIGYGLIRYYRAILGLEEQLSGQETFEMDEVVEAELA